MLTMVTTEQNIIWVWEAGHQSNPGTVASGDQRATTFSSILSHHRNHDLSLFPYPYPFPNLGLDALRLDLQVSLSIKRT